MPDTKSNKMSNSDIVTLHTPNSNIPASESFKLHLKRAQEFAELGVRENTRKAYAKDWTHFLEWVKAEELQLDFPEERIPPYIIAAYISDLAHEGKKVSTIERRLTTLAVVHRSAGFPTHEFPTKDDSVRQVLKGIRTHKGADRKPKDALVLQDLRQLLLFVPDTLLGYRDRAILLVGFAGALRRSKIVKLRVSDVKFEEDGMRLMLQASKTDKAARGMEKGIVYGKQDATCPVKALQKWLAESGIDEGPIFRPVNRWSQISQDQITDQSVAKVIKRYAVAAGFDQASYSGHSLRSGFITTAHQAGVMLRDLMEHVGHKKVETTMTYIRSADLLRNSPSGLVGL